MEALLTLTALSLCVVLPVALVIALIMWFGRRSRRATPGQDAVLVELERLMMRWHAAGQISDEAAAQLRTLIAAERRAPPAAMPVPPLIVQPATTELQPVAIPAALPPAARPAVPAGPTIGDRFGHALLALRTRQTLLFLGAFLLFVSALILIVFNWASFSPILQFALIAGVCAGFWAGGAWLIRNTELDRAGAGLQAVGGLLVPVVAFSLSRPGLLELAPRAGWLLASALCLPIYALAAWRLRRPIFAGAACASVASAVLAALQSAENRWLPAALIVTLACCLPLEPWLKRRAPALAPGPWWVAHAGAPLALLASVLLNPGTPATGALAAALWAGAGFYTLALALGWRPAWGWAAAGLALLALFATLGALAAPPPWWALAPALMMLAYLALALATEPRAGTRTLPAYAGAAGLAMLAIAAVPRDGTSARWALPLLVAGALATVLAYERGRLAWIAAPSRLGLAALSLGGAAALLAAWAAALLGLTRLLTVERALVLQLLAALYLLGAAGWPGRLRANYDRALQTVGVGLALIAATQAYSAGGLNAHTLTALAAIWLFQALRHRSQVWAAATLGTAGLAGLAWLLRADPADIMQAFVALALAFSAAYLVGGALLRHGAWRYWSLPALAWGAAASALGLLATAAHLYDSGVQGWHVLALLALAAIVALAGGLWRAAWPGFVVAGLLAGATLAAATRGFFTSWQPEGADIGYVLCAIALAGVLLGQALRRVAARYAYPYELVGYALLTFAPLLASGSVRHATLIWSAMMALYALAAWLYRLRWAAAPALLALDMALLSGAGWLLPPGRPAGAALILLAAAWFQGLLGLWASRRATPSASAPGLAALQPADVVAIISGAGALAIAARADDVLAIVGFGLAALLVLVSTARREANAAWGALVLLALGFAAWHRVLGLGPLWSMAWGVAEALGLCLLGWALELASARFGMKPAGAGDQARSVSRSPAAIWATPLSYGPLAAGTGLVAVLASGAPLSGNLPPLTFALAALALLMATLAVRKRASEYAYAAGGALVAAALCQLYDWGFRQPQWFVLPAGLYLLALGQGLRHLQRRRGAAQLLEAGAIVLLLGVSFGQSLRAEGLESQGYAAWLCAESLALLGYGVLAKLRAPFVGGVAFFVAGVLWLSADPLLALNKWVLLGILGLLLVGAYVLLERRQQQLVRAGRALIETVSGWG